MNIEIQKGRWLVYSCMKKPIERKRGYIYHSARSFSTKAAAELFIANREMLKTSKN